MKHSIFLSKKINPKVCTKKIIETPRFFSILTCSNSQIQTHALQFHLHHPKLIFLSTLESLKGQKNRKKLKYTNFQAISRINNFTWKSNSKTKKKKRNRERERDTFLKRSWQTITSWIFRFGFKNRRVISASLTRFSFHCSRTIRVRVRIWIWNWIGILFRWWSLFLISWFLHEFRFLLLLLRQSHTKRNNEGNYTNHITMWFGFGLFICSILFG